MKKILQKELLNVIDDMRYNKISDNDKRVIFDKAIKELNKPKKSFNLEKHITKLINK